MDKKGLWLLMGFAIALVIGCKSDSKKNKVTAEKNLSTVVTGKKAEKSGRITDSVPPLLLTAPVDEQKRLSALKKYYSGIKLRSDGKLNDAIDRIIEALKDNPGNLDARYQLAVTLAKNRNGGEALSILKQFHEAPKCDACYSMLAKAKKNDAFKLFKSNSAFASLVDGPAKRFEKELAAANWVSYDKAALEKKQVKMIFQGLPAISVDGKRMIAASLGRDRDGNVTSATVQILDGETGARLSAKRILFRPEGERILSGKMNHREAMSLLDKRISYIHSDLVVGKWIPFRLVAVEARKKLKHCGKDQHFAILKHKLELSEMKLKFSDGSTGKVTEEDIRKSLPAGNEVCATRAMINEIYINEIHEKILLKLGFCSDACQSTAMKWTMFPF